MASQDSWKVSETLLKKDCEAAWKQVNKNQAILNSHSNANPVGEPEDAILVISQMKVKCLQGEIDAVKEKKLPVLPKDPLILDTLLREQLERTLFQMEECLGVVEGRRRELQDDIARHDKLLTQHREMQQVLESRLRLVEQGEEGRPTEDNEVKALKRKQRRAGEIQTQLLKQIGEFVGKHFPIPNQTAGRSAHVPGASIKYSSLLEIIELLMNKGLGGESDPYIALNEAFWPPYIELLLRCGIASRHLQDANRIRLVPLNL